MTREESWQVEGVTLTLLRHVAGLGYVVSVSRIPPTLLGAPGFVEMTAVDPAADPPARHTAKVLETEAGDRDYRCACLLAQSVGVVLEDG